MPLARAPRTTDSPVQGVQVVFKSCSAPTGGSEGNTLYESSNRNIRRQVRKFNIDDMRFSSYKDIEIDLN